MSEGRLSLADALAPAKAKGRKIRHGAWVDDVSGNFPGWRFHVRGWESPDYGVRIGELVRDVPAADRADPGFIRSERYNALINQGVVECLLLGWEAPPDVDAPYSREQADAIFKDPEYWLFPKAVRDAIDSVGERGREATESDAKN